MIILNSEKLIFIATRKTAGSSIQVGLNEYLSPTDVQIGAWGDTLDLGGRLNDSSQKIIEKASLLRIKFLLKNLISRNGIQLTNDQVNSCITRYYRKNYMLGAGSHVSIRDVKRAFPEEFLGYHKFCVVRNPWDLMVSDYFWRTKGNPTISFDQYVEIVADPSHPDPAKLRPSFSSYWGNITIDDELAVDTCIKYEEMMFALPEFLSQFKINIRLDKIRAKGNFRKTQKRGVNTKYTIEKVAEIFSKEIDYFKYEYDGS